MNRQLSLTVFSVVTIAFVMSVFLLSPQLPAKVATHFNAAGQANGWMSRDGHVLTVLIMGLCIPAIIIGICYAVRFFPASTLNVPNKDYWRAKEHYPEACDFLFCHSFWMASLVVLLFASVNYLIVMANRLNPPMLDAKASFAAVIFFLIGTLAWVVFLILHFYRSGKNAPSARW